MKEDRQNYSGAKELFAKLAMEEGGHRKLLETFSMEKVVEAELARFPI